MSDSRIERLPENPRVICLGHALKESLSVRVALRALEVGVRLGDGEVVAGRCISDGGDGFLDAMGDILKGRRERIVAPGPRGRLEICEYLLNIEGNEAVIESALCIGLHLVPQGRRNVMDSGTSALGDVISSALSYGVKKIHIGLGGSATCDGGVGMLNRLMDNLVRGKRSVPAVANDLREPPPVDIRALREKTGEVEIMVYCDVTNPLLGKSGAAAVFGPQKGASPKEVEQLEGWMVQWADALEKGAGEKFRDEAGAGAAGGLGFALAALGGALRKGGEGVLELIEFHKLIENADVAISCEGHFDETSFEGKAPWVAASAAVEKGRHGLILAGIADTNAVREARNQGVLVKSFSQHLSMDRIRAESFSRLSDMVRTTIKEGR